MDSSDPALSRLRPGLRVVGVLGGVGSGKSTAARFLAEALAAPHLDADTEVARLFADPGLLARLDQEFGGGLLDLKGQLNRTELGERIFGDPERRRTLESILHPAVRRALWQGLQDAESTSSEKEPGFAVLDVPLLIENGLSIACDFLVYVRVPSSLRCERACMRHGWNEATWHAREAAQAPLSEKESAADAILGNASGVEDLRAAVEGLLPRLHALPPRSLRDRWPDPDRPPIAVDPKS
ncbi:MAG: dephospho-CoA kinase [Planctomycetes bacterium]|nr:dephospho-CoA kinase [Planctomycetota bacterium]